MTYPTGLWDMHNGVAIPVESVGPGPLQWQGPIAKTVEACRCGLPFVKHLGTLETCLGFFSPPGHDHNDNYMMRVYVCAEGHQRYISILRRCHACDWTGTLRELMVLEWPPDPCAALTAEAEKMGMY